MGYIAKPNPKPVVPPSGTSEVPVADAPAASSSQTTSFTYSDIMSKAVGILEGMVDNISGKFDYSGLRIPGQSTVYSVPRTGWPSATSTNVTLTRKEASYPVYTTNTVLSDLHSYAGSFGMKQSDYKQVLSKQAFLNMMAMIAGFVSKSLALVSLQGTDGGHTFRLLYLPSGRSPISSALMKKLNVADDADNPVPWERHYVPDILTAETVDAYINAMMASAMQTINRVESVTCTFKMNSCCSSSSCSSSSCSSSSSMFVAFINLRR